jgi:hypothetical protein
LLADSLFSLLQLTSLNHDFLFLSTDKSKYNQNCLTFGRRLARNPKFDLRAPGNQGVKIKRFGGTAGGIPSGNEFQPQNTPDTRAGNLVLELFVYFAWFAV